MAVYSVYNPTTQRYSYYEGPGEGGTHAGAPPRTLSFSPVGISPDQATWKLPPGARKIGEGELPKGKIAAMGGFDGGDGVKLGLLGVAAYLAWRYLK